MRTKYTEDNPFARLHTAIATNTKPSPWDEVLKAVLPKSTPVAKAAVKLQAHARGLRARRLSQEAASPHTTFESFLVAGDRQAQEEETQPAAGPIMETLLMNPRREERDGAPIADVLAMSLPWPGRALGAEFEEAASAAEVQAATGGAARPMRECPECGGAMLPSSPSSSEASMPLTEPPEQPLNPTEATALAETGEDMADEADEAAEEDVEEDAELKEVMGTPSQLEATDDAAPEAEAEPEKCFDTPFIYTREASSNFLAGMEEAAKPAAAVTTAAAASAPRGWAMRLLFSLLLLTLAAAADARCAAAFSAALPSWFSLSSPPVAPLDILPNAAPNCTVAETKQLVPLAPPHAAPDEPPALEELDEADASTAETATPATAACEETRGGRLGRPWHAQLKAAVTTNWLHKLARLG